MLTWETLTECIDNKCMDDDLRLVAQLLIQLKFHYRKTDMKIMFERAHERASTNSLNYFRQLFPEVK